MENITRLNGKIKNHDFQNRHLNLHFWGMGTSIVEARGWGDTCLASSSESGGVGSPFSEEIRSSCCVIVLSLDLRVALPEDELSDNG